MNKNETNAFSLIKLLQQDEGRCPQKTQASQQTIAVGVCPGQASPGSNAKQVIQTHRAGDWICLKCNNLNYSFRNRCNRCQIQSKKQNLLDNLLLINSETDSLDIRDENSTTQPAMNKINSAIFDKQPRVPFGDITNFNNDHNDDDLSFEKNGKKNTQGQVNKLRLRKEGGEPLHWTPFAAQTPKSAPKNE